MCIKGSQPRNSRFLLPVLASLIYVATTSALLWGNTGDHSDAVWELVGGEGRLGSWTASSGHNRVRALAVFQGKLYAGLGAADAEVWRFDGCQWELAGGASLLGSWPAREVATEGDDSAEPYWVNALLADKAGERLYAGLKTESGAQLWCFDGVAWEQLGGLGFEGDWKAGNYNNVYTLAWHNGGLYCGLQSKLPPSGAIISMERGHSELMNAEALFQGDVFRFDGRNWEKVGGPDFPAGEGLPSETSWIYKLISFEGHLFAAIGLHGINGQRWNGEVWRLTEVGWEIVGGHGYQGSWNPGHSHLVTSLFVDSGLLYAGYNCQDCINSPDSFSNVWAWDGRAWKALSWHVEEKDELLVSTQRSFNDFATLEGRLIVGGGRADQPGALAVWEMDTGGTGWKAIGSPRVNHFASHEEAELWKTGQYVYSLIVYDGALYAGIRGRDGSGHLWRYRVLLEN